MSRLTLIASAALGLAFAATLTSASAAEAPSPTRNCFYSRQLSSFSAAGEKTLNLRVGVNDYYQLKLLGRCTELPWTQVIGLETRGGSDFICSGLDVTLIVPRPGGGGPERCMATDLRKLTPAEVKALPSKQKP